MEGLDTAVRVEVVREKDELRRWKAKKSTTERIYTASPDALVKAAHLQSILKFIDSHPEPLAREIRSHIAPDTLKAVEGSMRIKWLPASVDVEMTEAAYVTLSPEEFKNFWIRYGLSTLGSPLLKHALEAALRLFGLSISRLITWTPQAFNAYYKNCGQLEVGEHTDRYCHLVHSGVPQGLIRSRPFIRGCAYAFAAIYPLTRTEGEVLRKDYKPANGSVTYLYYW